MEQTADGTDGTLEKKPWEEVFLNAYRQCGTVKYAAKKAKVGRTTVYRWREESTRFAKEFEDAQEDAVQELESAAWERAKVHSDTLLIFLLKANRPEKYREKFEQNHTGKVVVEVVYSDGESEDHPT